MTAVRRVGAEALGAALLLAIVVGSGIMGEQLAAGNDAVALIGNTLATAAGLFVLILIFGPVSGAHFNPVVTLVFALRREIAASHAAAYVIAQMVGAVIESPSRTSCSTLRHLRFPQTSGAALAARWGGGCDFLARADDSRRAQGPA